MDFHPVGVVGPSFVAAMLALGTGCSAASVADAADGGPIHDATAAAHTDAGRSARDPTDGGDASTHVSSFPAGTTVWPENGHGYLLVTQTQSLTWEVARADAQSRGGHLVTITSQAENDFVYSLVGTVNAAYSNNGAGDNGPWLGAYQPDGSAEPGGGWTWVTGEPFVYAEWAHCLDGTCTQPDNNGAGGIAENYLAYYTNWEGSSIPSAPGANRGPVFNDESLVSPVIAYIVEFE